MHRRRFLAAGAALILAPRAALALPPPFSLSGPRQQGSLVVGKTAMPCQVTLSGEELRVSPQGDFAFGIAYDRTEALRLCLIYPGSAGLCAVIAPVVRQFDIQRIDGLQEDYVSPPPEIAKRIVAENDKIFAVREFDSDGVGFAEPFDWPAPGIISGVFGSQRILNGEPKTPHFGVDIAAPEGTPICAPAGGVVTLAEPDFYLTGKVTVLDHGHGVSTTYMHQNEIRVAVGQKIARGDEIGRVGKTGRATGPHLHWAMNWFQTRLDPSLSARTLRPPSG
jgi:murein DD-endopeptidase MepM/ murein hydrolase activator NlpD